MLMTGADASFTTDGATTGAVGVGVVKFDPWVSGPSCVAHGELIYNAGDISGILIPGSPMGEFFGPANCLSAISGLGGVPCFDGTDHFVGGSLSFGGPAGSLVLSFAADYNYFDMDDGHNVITGGPVPFSFIVENSKSSTTAVGISPVGPTSPAFPGNGEPILNLTLQKQAAAMPGIAWGSAPFKGAQALSCAAYGVNSSDYIALSQSAPTATSGETITGAFEATLGSYVIFDAGHAGGELSFNANDSYVVPSTGPNPNNSFCPFSLIPQDYLDAILFPGAYGNSLPTPNAIFADGTANEAATMEGTYATNPLCGNLNVVGSGYADSSVQYGATDQQSYVIVTGLNAGPATGFVPVGGMSTCSSYLQATAGVALKTAAKSPAASTGTPTTALVTVMNNNEALCDTEVSMSPGTVTNSYTNGLKTWNTTCTLGLVGGSPTLAAAVGPLATAQTVAATACSCTCVDTGTYAGACTVSSATTPATTITETLTIASVACPIPVPTFPITCKN
jgi:hypothetical protein